MCGVTCLSSPLAFNGEYLCSEKVVYLRRSAYLCIHVKTGKMKYEVYCDESCLEAIFDKNAHKYAAIGGIWLPKDMREEMKTCIKEIKSKYSVMGELKWNKVTPKYLDMYKEIIDVFFNKYNIRFRTIIVESQVINNERYNQSCGELGFYKFYYQLLNKWLYPSKEYDIFLDYKVNGYRQRLHELHRILNNATMAKISNLQALPSHESLLIQMADILTGVVSAKFNGEVTSEAKLSLIKYVESYLGHEIKETGPKENKMNIFNINLQRGW